MMKIPKVKAERLKRNWNQTDLAFFARMSPSDISRIETGRMVPYSAHAQRLAKALGIHPDELLEKVELEKESV